MSRDGARVSQAALARVEENRPFFDTIQHKAITPQEFLLLLQKSGVPRGTFMMRTTAPLHVAPAAKALTEMVHTAFYRKLDIGEEELTDDQRTQLTLSVKKGGLGLPDFGQISPGAWLASQAASRRLIAAMVPAAELSTDSFLAVSRHACESLRATCPGDAKLARFLPDDGNINHLVPAESREDGKVTRLQQAITSATQLHTLQGLITRADNQGKARLLSVSAPGNGYFFNAMPGDVGCAVSASTTCLAARFRLGLPPTRVRFRPMVACGLCDRGARADIDPWHGLNCPDQRRKGVLHRHDSVLQRLDWGARAIGASTTIEPRINHQNRTKPDMRIQLGNKVLYTDVVITNPCAPSHVRKAQQQLGASDAAEKRKNDKYAEEAKRIGTQFVAFNLETTGAFGRGSRTLLKLFQHAYKPEVATEPWHAIHKQLTRSIACAVQIGNANAMERWLSAANVLEEPNFPAEPHEPAGDDSDFEESEPEDSDGDSESSNKAAEEPAAEDAA